MKSLTLCSALMAFMACSARPVERSASDDHSLPSDGGLVVDGMERADAAGPAPRALDRRLELVLAVNVPVEIEPLGLTVTLIDAYHTTRRHPVRGFMHTNVAVIRFERAGEAPFDVRFGQERDNHTLFGHGFAVFGGTQLSVFPPGMPIDP